EFFLGWDVVWIAERDIQLVVRTDAAGTCTVVEAFFSHRDEFTLWNDDARGDVRPFIEELGCWKYQHAVVLDTVQEAVLGEAQSIRHFEAYGGREALHVVCHAALGSVCYRPYLVFPSADKHDAGRGPDRHVPGVRHNGIEADRESLGKLDVLENALDCLGTITCLRDGLDIQRGACRAHVHELFNVVRNLPLTLCDHTA